MTVGVRNVNWDGITDLVNSEARKPGKGHGFVVSEFQWFEVRSLKVQR
jgi:hypothetical protein